MGAPGGPRGAPRGGAGGPQGAFFSAFLFFSRAPLGAPRGPFSLLFSSFLFFSLLFSSFLFFVVLFSSFLVFTGCFLAQDTGYKIRRGSGRRLLHGHLGSREGGAAAWSFLPPAHPTRSRTRSHPPGPQCAALRPWGLYCQYATRDQLPYPRVQLWVRCCQGANAFRDRVPLPRVQPWVPCRRKGENPSSALAWG